MDLRNMVWIGETVKYGKKNAVLLDIDFPYVYLNVGEPEPLKVRYDTIKKINFDGVIDPRNN